MTRVLGVLGTMAILAALATFSGPAASSLAQSPSCDNFPIQSAAQTFLQATGEDPNQLDGPNDNGIACEELPCPCDNEPIPELIGDAPTPTPTATNTPTNTPSPTQAPSGGAQATATPTATSIPDSNTLAAATATSIAVTATTAALTGVPPATVAPGQTQSVITPPSTGTAGLK